MREFREVDGFRQPLHKSLTEPLLLAGVPRQFVIINCGLAAMSFIIFHSLFVLPLHFVFHFVCSMITKKDPLIFQIIKRYLNTKDFYNC